MRVTPAAELALVPPLLVQPLVENAIKHGKVDRPLRVVVRCEVRLGRLRITVRDNGRGIPRELADRVLEPGVGSGAAGLGLASAAQRVAVFYGEHGRLRIASAPRIGTLISIVIPTVPPGHELGRRRAMSLLALIVDDEAPARAELRFLLDASATSRWSARPPACARRSRWPRASTTTSSSATSRCPS